jgi:hypothetical protein
MSMVSAVNAKRSSKKDIRKNSTPHRSLRSLVVSFVDCLRLPHHTEKRWGVLSDAGSFAFAKDRTGTLGYPGDLLLDLPD